MSSRVLRSESIEDFLKNSGIEEKHIEITSVIRNTLSKWTGKPPTSFVSVMSIEELHCQGWDSTEFMWHILDELGLDLLETQVDFPSLYSCELPFFNKKNYKTIGEWTKAIVYEWFLSSRFESAPTQCLSQRADNGTEMPNPKEQ